MAEFISSLDCVELHLDNKKRDALVAVLIEFDYAFATSQNDLKDTQLATAFSEIMTERSRVVRDTAVVEEDWISRQIKRVNESHEPANGGVESTLMHPVDAVYPRIEPMINVQLHKVGGRLDTNRNKINRTGSLHLSQKSLRGLRKLLSTSLQSNYGHHVSTKQSH